MVLKRSGVGVRFLEQLSRPQLHRTAHRAPARIHVHFVVALRYTVALIDSVVDAGVFRLKNWEGVHCTYAKNERFAMFFCCTHVTDMHVSALTLARRLDNLKGQRTRFEVRYVFSIFLNHD